MRAMWLEDVSQAWLDAVRAAELAKRLIYAAAEVADAAEPGALAGSDGIAELATHAAEAAEAAAARARRAAATAARAPT
jgi:hypothetical protein